MDNSVMDKKQKLYLKFSRAKANSKSFYDRFVGILHLKMVALDLDGTALNDDKEISDSNIEALESQRDKNSNVLVNIVTGRGYHNAIRYANQIKADYFATDNGGAIFKRQEDGSYDLIKQCEMNLRDVRGILTQIMYNTKSNPELAFHLSTPKDFIIGNAPGDFEKAHDTFYPGEEFGEGVIQIGSFEQLEKMGMSDEIIKMCVDFGKGESSYIQKAELEKLLDYGKIPYFRTSDTKIEIAPEGVNKGSALMDIIKAEKEKDNEIRRKGVLYIGDSGNDVPAFEQGFQCFCPSNTKEEVKEKMPKRVIVLKSTNNGQLIGEALKRFSRKTESIPKKIVDNAVGKVQKNIPRFSMRDYSGKNQRGR